jgi:hypothetical protein
MRIAWKGECKYDNRENQIRGQDPTLDTDDDDPSRDYQHPGVEYALNHIQHPITDWPLVTTGVGSRDGDCQMNVGHGLKPYLAFMTACRRL